MPRPLALLLAVLLSVAAAPATAQEELALEEQRAYAQGITEVRGLLARGEIDAAGKRVDALLARRPREAQARFFRGMVQTERKDTAGAIQTFEALVADYPELPEPYNNLAVLYASKGDLEGAQRALETALKTEPDFALAHENLGDVHARIAAAHYQRAAELDRASKSAPAKLALARDLLNPGAAAKR